MNITMPGKAKVVTHENEEISYQELKMQASKLKFSISHSDKHEELECTEILYIQQIDDCCIFHMADRKPVKVYRELSYIISMISDIDVFELRGNYLINKLHIKKHIPESIAFDNGETLIIAYPYK